MRRPAARPYQGEQACVDRYRNRGHPPGYRRATAGVTPASRKREGTVEISARNQLPGTVQSVKTGAVMAEIVVNVEAGTIAAVITDSSREHLNLQEGDLVTVVIKATEVMIAK